MRLEFLLKRDSKHPSKNLVINSNDRFHFRSQAQMTKQLRKIGASRVPQVTPFSEERPCKVIVSVSLPTRRRFDPPNIYPTVKALLDGMTDGGLWTDDNSKVIQSLEFRDSGMLSEKKGYYKLEIEVLEVVKL